MKSTLVVIVQWQQDKNGKEAREETAVEDKKWKGNIRESKTETVLELSLEVHLKTPLTSWQ